MTMTTDAASAAAARPRKLSQEQLFLRFCREVDKAHAARSAKYDAQLAVDAARERLGVALRTLLDGYPDAASHPAVEHWVNNLEYLK